MKSRYRNETSADLREQAASLLNEAHRHPPGPERARLMRMATMRGLELARRDAEAAERQEATKEWMLNTHIIRVARIPPTNHRPARVKLTSGRNSKDSVTLPFDYRFAYTIEYAKAWLREHGYHVVAYGDLSESEYVVGVREFTQLKLAQRSK